MIGTGFDLGERLREAGLRSPKTLTLAITQGCNLACGHCLVQSPDVSRGNPVPGAVLGRLIRDFVRLGGEAIVLTGGEPLTHPRWLEIVSRCCREPQLRTVGLQTNAALLTAGDVRALASLRCEGLRIEVSLEGASPGAHGLVRGAGAFASTLRGLRLLAEGGLGGQTRLAFTEMRHNVEDLPELLELADRLGISTVTSASVVLAGRARQADHVAPPEPAQYAGLLRRLHADPRFRELARTRARITALAWWEGRAHPDPHVCDFVERPYVSADGRMYPCPVFQADELAAPGCHERPLAEVIADAAPMWSELKRVSEQRREGLEPCRGCPGFSHCRGGCMARAWAAHGDCMTPEDRCALRRAVYAWAAP